MFIHDFAMGSYIFCWICLLLTSRQTVGSDYEEIKENGTEEDLLNDCKTFPLLCQERERFQSEQETHTRNLLEGHCLDHTWVPYKTEKCFKVWSHEKVSFEEAWRTCKSLGPDHSTTLAIVRNKEEQDFLANHVFDELQLWSSNVWLGMFGFANTMTDPNATWTYKTVDSDQPISFLNWGPNNPSNGKGKDDGESFSCVQMSPSDSQMMAWDRISRANRTGVKGTTEAPTFTSSFATTFTSTYSSYDQFSSSHQSQFESTTSSMPTTTTECVFALDNSEASDINAGLWSDVSCHLQNSFVCQSEQSQSFMTVQHMSNTNANNIAQIQSDYIWLTKEISQQANLIYGILQQLEEISHAKASLHSNVTSLWEGAKDQVTTLQQHSNLQDQLKSYLNVANEKVSILEYRVQESQNGIQNVLSRAVPIGFIYVQLPWTDPPSNIWPSFSWSEVTYNYAGLFFRAGGGAAESFGSNQGSSSPRLVKAASYDDPDSQILGEVDVPLGSYSNPVRSGNFHGADKYAIKLMVSSVETRPVNTAVKIWKRVG